MTFHDLHLYSEWLDSNGLMEAPHATDTRTHDDLVNQFLVERSET